MPVVWTVLFLLCNAVILLRGVQKGIEKVSNVLMPVLFVILVIFCINSLLMPGAKDGLEFLFRPDFSKVDSSVLIGRPRSGVFLPFARSWNHAHLFELFL